MDNLSLVSHILWPELCKAHRNGLISGALWRLPALTFSKNSHRRGNCYMAVKIAMQHGTSRGWHARNKLQPTKPASIQPSKVCTKRMCAKGSRRIGTVESTPFPGIFALPVSPPALLPESVWLKWCLRWEVFHWLSSPSAKRLFCLEPTDLFFSLMCFWIQKMKQI